ncbi:hypothetical protein ACHAXT_013214 [Thalassiosira profunda]
MLVNPLVAAAAVAARAFTLFSAPQVPVPPPVPPIDASSFPRDEHFDDSLMDQELMDQEVMYGHQARELEDFMGSVRGGMPPPMEREPVYCPPVDVKDAEIVGEERSPVEAHGSSTSGTKPKPLPDTNHPHLLLGISLDATFDDVRRAYKRLVKIYHPDAAVGPDASDEERQSANRDFARINAAYDILKRRENEEVFEYTVYEDGQRVKRSVVNSEESRRRDPHRVDYDRIRYGNRQPRERMWYENEHSYQPRCNGFDGYASSHSSPYARGRWWSQHNYEPLKSDQTRWSERHAGREAGGAGFGGTPRRDPWWDEDPSLYESHRSREECPPRMEGFAYKDRVWGERLVSDDYEPRHTMSGPAPGYEYETEDFFPPTEKWWNADDDNSWSNFAP